MATFSTNIIPVTSGKSLRTVFQTLLRHLNKGHEPRTKDKSAAERALCTQQRQAQARAKVDNLLRY